MKKTLLTAASAAFLAFAAVATAGAETVTTTTTVTPRPILNAVPIDLVGMDFNHDGILTRQEIGSTLFALFDADNNRVIDNIEFYQPRFITTVPAVKTTTVAVDFNDDGIADSVQVTSSDVLRLSRLYIFDENKNGLSAHEFIREDYLALDTDDSHAIEIDEWQIAYSDLLKSSAASQDLYNPS